MMSNNEHKFASLIKFFWREKTPPIFKLYIKKANFPVILENKFFKFLLERKCPMFSVYDLGKIMI